MKIALITGVTGQDGSYLTELLLQKGYEVHGILRRASLTERPRLDHIPQNAPERDRLHLHYADLADSTTLRRVIAKVRPDEVYHLAGQSHVGLSFEIPESSVELTAMGTLRLLEIIRDCDHQVKFLNVGSSEIFGRPTEAPQSVETAMVPTSPYGAAKAFSVNAVRIWREAFGLFAVNAICYNHESPRRGLSFVTRKIARGVAEIARGQRDTIFLGNLDTQRDWGYAPEYVEAMWRMLQMSDSKDLVLATGRLTSLAEFLQSAFSVTGLNWRDHVRIDPRFVRPTDPTSLLGDPSAARESIGWQAKVVGPDLAKIMVQAEMLALNGEEQDDTTVLAAFQKTRPVTTAR